MKIIYSSDLHYGLNHSTRKIHEKFFNQISEEKPDIFILAGDNISDSQHQYNKFFKLLSSKIQCTIFVVNGNHDYWCMKEKRKNSYSNIKTNKLEDLFDYHKTVYERYGIYYLQDDPWFDLNHEVALYGFDGWYGSLNPPSNDTTWMPSEGSDYLTHYKMSTRAYESLSNILENVKHNLDYTHKICVTHFNLYNAYRDGDITMTGSPKYLDFLAKDFDYLICGHSHQEADFIHEFEGNKIRVLNAGSDYNVPAYKVLNL